jgi:hypothetical protein
MFSYLFCILLFEGKFTVHKSSEIKNPKKLKIGRKEGFLTFLLVDGRIWIQSKSGSVQIMTAREAQKHMDSTDPDTQHTGEICQLVLRLILKGKKVVKKFSRFQVTRHNVNFGNVKF